MKAASQTQPNASTANRISKKADAIKGAVAANVDLDDELTQMCRAAVEDKVLLCTCAAPGMCPVAHMYHEALLCGVQCSVM